MGQPSALPLYITSTALGKLAHPEGEVALTRAAHKQGRDGVIILYLVLYLLLGYERCDRICLKVDI
jgi:isopentenyl diphosphate isomerase/L-lactate dehydrogenase-like FMN-dependent dehydrogenase